MDAMSKICDAKNYNVYEYPPPKMRVGCESILNVTTFLMQFITTI